MTANLNKAFIKAYTKESTTRQEPGAANVAIEKSEIDDLVVRFDTASVDVPEPKAAKMPLRPVRRSSGPPAAPMVEPGPSGVPSANSAQVDESRDDLAVQQAVPAPKLNVAADVRHSEVVYSDHPEDASLRQSIASHMLSAGDWQGQQVDAFWGAAPSPSDETAEKVAEAPKVEPPAGEQVVAAEGVGRVPELEAPAAPALDAQAATKATSLPTPEAVKPRGDQVSAEVFRLDRPSYYPHAPQPAEHGAESSVSEIEVAGDIIPESEAAESRADDRDLRLPSEGYVNPIIRTDAAAQANSSPEQQVDPLMTEAKLREATNRVFNPVWEVDSLHWPHICFDLLARGGGQMDAVAENLVAACEEGLQVMAVTSPKGGEGRTTIACCLAILAGSRGLKVAIVDGDLESPSLSFQTNLDVEQDWRTAIEHQIPLEEIAVHSIEDQVTVVPLIAPVGHEELSSDDDRIAGMLNELADSFDLVIVDMGPMDSSRSLVSTMGECGILSAVVAVVDRRQDAADQLEACLRRIRQAGVVSVGLVENFAA